MPGLYSHTNRISGELITATKYNSDHQNHIDNQTPQMTDDYSSSVGQMQAVSDAGEVGSESLPTSLAGELERLRFAIGEAKGTTQWYESATTSLTALKTLTDASLDLLLWRVI